MLNDREKVKNRKEDNFSINWLPQRTSMETDKNLLYFLQINGESFELAPN